MIYTLKTNPFKMEITLGHAIIIVTTLITVYFTVLGTVTLSEWIGLICGIVGILIVESMLSNEDKLILFSNKEEEK